MTVQEIFKKCCSRDAGRYSLETPFPVGPYIYATNGHLAVRILAEKYGEVVAPVKDTPPGIQELPWDGSGNVETLPDVTIAPPVPCSCMGKDIRCDNCGGSGEMECHECGQDTDCDECDGSGTKVCEKCNEDRMIELTPKAIAVGSGWIADRYAAMLRSFGVTKVIVPVKNNQPVRFNVGDIEGILMQTSSPVTGANP